MGNYDKMTLLYDLSPGDILTDYLVRLNKAATGRNVPPEELLTQYRHCFPNYFTVADVEEAIENSVQYANRAADVSYVEYEFMEEAERAIQTKNQEEDFELVS